MTSKPELILKSW